MDNYEELVEVIEQLWEEARHHTAIALHPLNLSDGAFEAFVAGELNDLRDGLQETERESR